MTPEERATREFEALRKWLIDNKHLYKEDFRQQMLIALVVGHPFETGGMSNISRGFGYRRTCKRLIDLFDNPNLHELEREGPSAEEDEGRVLEI